MTHTIEPPTEMRCLMGEAHRRRILSECREGTRILEWGMGGTTAWLASRLPRQAQLTSIEHDPRWFTQVREQVGVRANCDLRLRPSSAAPGRNATVEEENTDGLTDYIMAAGDDSYDIILVDGVARNACLEQAARLLAPGGRVFLHDAQRPWYDAGKRHLTEVEVVGACPDYPPPWLWVGTSRPAAIDATGAAPVIVSFFTAGTGYEELAARLQQDCRALGLEAVIEPVTSTGSWARNTNLKAEFCRRQWRTLGRPLLWVDVDARIRQRPSLGALGTADIGVHKWAGWQLATGTMFFNQTEPAASFLDCWCTWCERLPDLPDQIAADLAWERVSSRSPLRTAWLPQNFCHIFDSAAPDGAVVIEHFQASRHLKAAVSRAAATPYPESTPLLRACRTTSRPRRWVASHHDSADALTELVSEIEDELPSRHGADDDELAWLCTIRQSLHQHGDAALWDRLLRAGRALAASRERYVVYGNGEIGRQLAAACRHHGTPPVAFVQSRVTTAVTCDAMPVWTPEQARAQGIRVFLLGTLASGEAMRVRLESTFGDSLERPRIEPASDPTLVRVTDAGTLAHVHDGLASIARGRHLSEHAWLCAHRAHLIDASLCIAPAVERLLHIDRYRFVATHAGGRSVLDLTAGTGDGCRWLASHGYARRVDARVADGKALAYAQRHHAHAAVEYRTWGDGALEQIPTASVQLVLQLMPSAAHAQEALPEPVQRCLTADGCLVTSLPPAALEDTSTTAAAASLDVLRDHFAEVVIHGQWQASSERPGRMAPISSGGDSLPDVLLAVCRRPRRTSPNERRSSGSSERPVRASAWDEV